jgi:UDP-N-acetylmuramoyl-L-alanyl-D-glutamate--2,6-diaminopimelate ligase
MKLAQLLEGLGVVDAGDAPDVEVSGIAYDSRAVRPGDVFFALKGGRSDGGEFVADAIARGAVAAVAERGAGPKVTVVADARRALALASHRFYGDPTARLRVAGVTGTAGKTTTTFLLESMLRAAGRRTGLVGTVVYRFAGHEQPAPLTTPQSTDLARMMDEMARAGVDTVAMEVTSHALAQHRATGVRFAAAAFTNMSREHLDFHADMEDYFHAKLLLFTSFGVGDRAAFNVEDPWARRAREESGARGIGFGLAEGADVTARDPRFGSDGIRAEIVTPAGAIGVVSPLVGRINLMNILCATSLATLLGIEPAAIAEGVRSLSGVPGRMENVGRPFGRRVIVDFSHKLDALTRVLAIGRTLGPGRLVTVIGCGGDRDQGKRPLMGRAAAEGSDVVVLTSDNPRSEDPLAILRAIEEGIEGTGCRRFDPAAGRAPEGRGLYTIVEDRAAAIRLAVASAGPDDTVLICGKGHETYQIVGDTVRHFDDREEAAAALREQLGAPA